MSARVRDRGTTGAPGRELASIKSLHDGKSAAKGFGGRRVKAGVDLYHLMNVDVVTAYNQTFVPGGPWLAPTALQPARYARLSLEIDF